MGKLDKIERQIQQLPPKEFVQFRDRFLDRDWSQWDRQLEQDVRAGKLDALGRKALAVHAAGKTTPL